MPILFSFTYFISLIYPTALVPDPVHKLNVSVEPNTPTMSLTWDPPHNVKEIGTQCSLLNAIQYHIRFKPNEREHYDEISVDSSTTSMVLNRESGLIPLTTSTFEVRAQCGEDLGEWNMISGYIGECKEVFEHHIFSIPLGGICIAYHITLAPGWAEKMFCKSSKPAKFTTHRKSKPKF